MPFTASTLQIVDYHSYQHRKLQAAQVTITDPDSADSAFEAFEISFNRESHQEQKSNFETQEWKNSDSANLYRAGL